MSRYALAIILAIASAPDSTSAQDNREDSVRISIGASFDFLDELTASDIYADLVVSIPNIWGRFGVEAGLHNGRSTGDADTLAASAFASIPRAGSDSVSVIQQDFTRALESSEDRLGLFAGITYETRPSLFLTFQAEVLKRDLIAVTRDTITLTDTLAIVPDSMVTSVERLPANARLNRRLHSNRSRTSDVTVYQSLLGVGAIVRHMIGDDIRVYLKPLFGAGLVAGEWECLLSVQFAVTDFEHGFKVGGDVRSGVEGDDVSVVVYLAKSFTTKKLADIIAR